MFRDNVRISSTGHKLLQNKELASRVAKAISTGKHTLESGEVLKVADSKIIVKMVNSIKAGKGK